MIKDFNAIVNSIKNEGVSFLTDNMSIEIINIEFVNQIFLDNHISTIKLIGKYNITIIISIDDNLFSSLFDKFFQTMLSCEEQQELKSELPNEIINTIVGLSIQYFPKKYDDMILQPPIQIEKERLDKFLSSKESNKFKIVTSDGSLDFLIVLSE